MSIFSRMKKKKEEDMKNNQEQTQAQQSQSQQSQQPNVVGPQSQQGQVQQQQPQQQQQSQQTRTKPQEPAPIPRPQQKQQQSFMDRVTQQEVREEIIELSDAEKREFVNVLLSKYRGLYKDLESVLATIEEMKIKRKRKLEQEYQAKLNQIDKTYDKQKEIVKNKYQPTLDRYKGLAEKFKVPLGGVDYEDTSEFLPRPNDQSEMSGTERFEQRAPPGDQSLLSQESSLEPEISKLLRKIDSKYNLK